MALSELLKIKELEKALEILIIKAQGHDCEIVQRIEEEIKIKYKISVQDLSTLKAYKINDYEYWYQKYKR